MGGYVARLRSFSIDEAGRGRIDGAHIIGLGGGTCIQAQPRGHDPSKAGITVSQCPDWPSMQLITFRYAPGTLAERYEAFKARLSAAQARHGRAR